MKRVEEVRRIINT